jgi:hypothetical protein
MRDLGEKKFPTIQNIPWQTSLDSIKLSENFLTYNEFYKQLIEALPQNSFETRKKYATLIQRRFFPEKSLTSLLPLVWKTYKDESLLISLMRVYALEAEPVIAKFVSTNILSNEPGYVINMESVKGYISEIYGKFQRDSYNRLVGACRDLGFTGHYDGKIVIKNQKPNINSILLLIHDKLAKTPQIVRVEDIYDSKWRSWLGFSFRELRELLYMAESAGLISLYSKVDELEQITTRFTRNDYINRALKL